MSLEEGGIDTTFEELIPIRRSQTETKYWNIHMVYVEPYLLTLFIRSAFSFIPLPLMKYYIELTSQHGKLRKATFFFIRHAKPSRCHLIQQQPFKRIVLREITSGNGGRQVSFYGMNWEYRKHSLCCENPLIFKLRFLEEKGKYHKVT